MSGLVLLSLKIRGYVITTITILENSFNQWGGSNSAEGATFNSRGRKAVDRTPKTIREVRRTDINPTGLLTPHPSGGGTNCVAPSALHQLLFDYPRPYGRDYLMTVLRTSLSAPLATGHSVHFANILASHFGQGLAKVY